MSEAKLYACKFGLRPRINGKVAPISIGKPFSKDVISPDTFKAMLDAGSIYPYQEKVEDAVILDEKQATEVVEESGSSDDERMEQIRKDALENFGVELNQRKLETIKKAYAKLEKKATDKPTGIFNLKIEDLAEKDVDELDSIHAEICAVNGIDAPEPFKSVEAAIEKLTSEG